MSLVLVRRVGEILCIGPDIEVQIMDVKGRQVSIAVRAPKDVSVDRLEVRQRKDRGEPPPVRS